MPPVNTSQPPYSTAEQILQLARTILLDASISINGNLLGDTSPGVVITAISETAGVVTVQTQQAHGLAIGSLVTVLNVLPNGYNGQFQVASVPALNQFTYNNPTTGLAAGEGGSVSIAPSQAFVYLNSAYRYVQSKLANMGLETPIEEVILSGITPMPAAVQGPGARVYIGYDVYFDGQQNWSLNSNPLPSPNFNAILPNDLKIPKVLKERVSGTSFTFRPMGMANDGLSLRSQQPFFGEWDWRGLRLYLIGATQTLDLWMRYEAFFPALVFPTDSIRIEQAENAIAYTLANRFSAPRMGDVGGHFTAERDEEIKQIGIRYAQKNQRRSTRPQPYGGGHASGCNDYDYF